MTELFTLPTPKRFEALCRKYEFSDKKMKELGGILWRTHLKFRNSSIAVIDGDERKRILRLLNKFKASLDQLLWALDLMDKDIAKFNSANAVPIETDAGKRATARLVAAAAGRKKLKKDPLQDLVHFAAHGSAGLGDQLLKVKQSIDLIVYVTVKDRGGQPADLVRHYLVKELCKSSQRILDKSPSSTAGGTFAKFAHDVVVDCCGLSDDGLEKIIERNVSSFKRRK